MQGYATKNEVLAALNTGVHSGQFKSCTHLKYTQHRILEYYFPVCEQDSFVVPQMANQFSEGNCSCPQNCLLFRDFEIHIATSNELQQAEQRVIARRQFLQTVRTVLAAPFVYFKSLPALVQSLIIILVIIWKLPKAKETILEIVKAIGGK